MPLLRFHSRWAFSALSRRRSSSRALSASRASGGSPWIRPAEARRRQLNPTLLQRLSKLEREINQTFLMPVAGERKFLDEVFAS